MVILKMSLVCTVLNEGNTIGKFIDSIACQSVVPSEVIIVDGGSKDNTVFEINKKIKQYSKKLNIKLLTRDGNRSVGRNFGIRKASSDIILLSDSGCILDKDWVKEIIKPFADSKVEVVAGYYKGESRNFFQKSLIPYVLVMVDKIDKKNFLPATRSMAIKKNIWKRLGGFDEGLSHNEDYAFANKLKEKNVEITFTKKAIVRWMPRKNLAQSFKMFFRFALGDSQAKIYRNKVIYIFLRYIFAFYLIALVPIMRSLYFDLIIILIGLSYVAWSIWKNYKYVNNYRAYFYLPLLQFTSDVAVLLGTSLGFIQQISIRSIFNLIFKNKLLFLIIFIYSALMIYFIQWGIPSQSHPFNYAMDEWHFSQALRTFFKDGTGSVSGAASIPFYHIVSSILFLIPFYLLHIVNPFAIKNTLDNLPMQHILFEVLRLHTLFYGILSIVVIHKILKLLIKPLSLIFTALFVFNPIWISLTNYYKYDITLSFWIITTLYFLIKFYKTQELKNYLFAGIACGLALSTKFTAAPLFLGYIIGYFLLTNKIIHRKFIAGILVSIFVFAFVGIPDLIFGKGNYYQLLYSTLIEAPKISTSFNLGEPGWFFLLFNEFPSIFGYFLSFIFYLSLVFWSIYLLLALINKSLNKHRLELSIFITTLLFLLSTISFSVDGGGNRALVLIPFIIIISAFSIYKIMNLNNNKIINMILLLGLTLQIIQSASWLSVKFYPDPRQTSSAWVLDNIPKNSDIGIENIPIYQMLPDIILKEYYFKERNNNFVTLYKYSIVSLSDRSFPKYVIITNDANGIGYFSQSLKKELLNKLKNQGYKKVVIFTPMLKYYEFFADKKYFLLTNILTIPINIAIYEKQ